MELEVQSHQGVGRKPDWAAAAVSGLVAGAVAIVLDLLWRTLMLGLNPWHTSHLVAAMVLGPGALAGNTNLFEPGIVTTALLTHYGLGILFGSLVAYVVAGLRDAGSLPMLAIVGGVLGMLLYFFNFYVMTAVFPWVEELRSGAYFVEHFVFGMTAAMVYRTASR